MVKWCFTQIKFYFCKTHFTGIFDGGEEGILLGFKLIIGGLFVFILGDTLGKKDGLLLGIKDGIIDGFLVGTKEGFPVGIADGLLLGMFDGTVVGLSVG